MSGLPEISSEYSSTYKRISVAGIFGGIRANGVDAIIFSEQQDVKKVLETEPLSANRITLKRIVEAELVIDPMQLKSIHKWLGDKIKEYESVFGVIPSPEEVDSRLRRNRSPGQ